MASAQQSPDEEITGINVVPLVDIVLVLLIIFMVTANVIARPAIDMELPAADTAERKERNQFSLLLGKDGSVAIGDKRIDEESFSRELQRITKDYKNQKQKTAAAAGSELSDHQLTLHARNELTMVLQADAAVSHGRIIHFIDEARKAGIVKYAFNVDSSRKSSTITRVQGL